MAYSFNPSQAAAPIPNNTLINQSVQPIFPQPQGNVYNINSTLEVANVPVGAGISVALCLNEGIMYIKSMQNGNPLFWAYKIEPYEANSNKTQNEVQKESKNDISQLVEQYDNRFNRIEKEISTIQNSLRKNNGGEFNI